MQNPVTSESSDNARRLYEQGKFAESERICREILRQDPDQTEALSILGYLALRGGAPRIALECFQRLISLQPDIAAHHAALASTLRLAGRHDEALLAQQHCADLAPHEPEALQNLASQYSEMGKLELARETYARVLHIAPDFGRAHYGLALIKTFQRDDQQITQMRTLLGNDQSNSENSGRIAFSLGKAFEDIGEYDQAFEYYAQGNRIKRSRIKFDAANENRNAQRIEQAFSAELREASQGMGAKSELPVFIVGMPRSGSTLVEQIIDAHPDVHGAGEISNLFRVIERGFHELLPEGDEFPEAVAKVSADAWQQLGNHYLASIRGLAPQAKRIIDKQLFNYSLVGAIYLMLPQARIIHCTRNPLDTCVSCFTQNFGSERGFSCDLTELGQTYRAYQQMMDHWRTWLPSPMLEVAYEEVVAEPETQARRLIDFLGLDWSDACLDFHKNKRPVITSSQGQVRRAVYKSSVERWRRFESHLDPLKAALAKDA